MNLICEAGHPWVRGNRRCRELVGKPRRRHECGAKVMKPLDRGFGHAGCGEWFATFEEWQAHVYGPGVTTYESPAVGCQKPLKWLQEPQVSGGGNRRDRAAYMRQYRRKRAA